MWFVSFAVSAQAQVLELTTHDQDTTTTLVTGLSWVVDVTNSKIDLERLGLATPGRQTTFGRVYDELLESEAEVDDGMVVTLGETGEMWVWFAHLDDDDMTNGRECHIAYELQCGCWIGCACQYVPVRLVCCHEIFLECDDYLPVIDGQF